MAGISNGVHEAQGRSREQSVPVVILDHDQLSRHPHRLLEKPTRISGMMENIGEQNRVKGIIFKRNRLPVKSLHRDGTISTFKNIDTAYLQIRARRSELLR